MFEDYNTSAGVAAEVLVSAAWNGVAELLVAERGLIEGRGIQREGG